MHENLRAAASYRTEKYKRGSRGIAVELMESLGTTLPSRLFGLTLCDFSTEARRILIPHNRWLCSMKRSGRH